MRAAARGESLKALLTRAVVAELRDGTGEPGRQRVELPLFGDPQAPPVDLSGSDLARLLADDDANLAGGRQPRQ